MSKNSQDHLTESAKAMIAAARADKKVAEENRRRGYEVSQQMWHEIAAAQAPNELEAYWSGSAFASVRRAYRSGKTKTI